MRWSILHETLAWNLNRFSAFVLRDTCKLYLTPILLVGLILCYIVSLSFHYFLLPCKLLSLRPPITNESTSNLPIDWTL